jgi:hypothetical protein
MQDKSFFEIVADPRNPEKAKLKVIMVPDHPGKRSMDDISVNQDRLIALLKKVGIWDLIDVTSFKRFVEIGSDGGGLKILSRISCRIRNHEGIKSKLVEYGFREGTFRKIDGIWVRGKDVP